MVVLGKRDILVVGKVVVLGQKLGRFQKNPLVTLQLSRGFLWKQSRNLDVAKLNVFGIFIGGVLHRHHWRLRFTWRSPTFSPKVKKCFKEIKDPQNGGLLFHVI